MNINKFAIYVHEQNKAVGWWDDPKRCLLTVAQLINSEVCEATEGARKSLNDDHLPAYDMELVEFADAGIRVLDLMAFLKLHYHEGFIDLQYKKRLANCPHTPGALHLILSMAACDVGACILDNRMTLMERAISNFINVLLSVVKIRYNLGPNDLVAIAKEKHDYNANRLDHKRENRAKSNGKKF